MACAHRGSSSPQAELPYAGARVRWNLNPPPLARSYFLRTSMSSQPFRVADLFSFERLISTSLVKLLYFVGMIGGVIGGLIAVVAALGTMRYNAMGGIGALLIALLLTAAGLLVWRVLCEGMILAFSIYDRLGEMRDQLAKRSTPAA